jgi:hypothetical protein
MKLFLNVALPLTAFLCTPIDSVKAADIDCKIAESAIRSASVIRKLRIKSSVPCKIHDRSQIKQFILETMDVKVPQQKLIYEEMVYKAIGMIPETFNYREGILELYLSQIGGYYDPDKKRYVMAGWLPEIFQTSIAVHELTHALQDQYFQLDTFLDIKKDTSDNLMAKSALVEGDATAVMLDYTRLQTGQSGIAEEESVENVMLQNIFGVALSMGAVEVPETLKFMLVFPYTSGLRFAHELLKSGGYTKVNQAFQNPPRSTEQILHPDKYMAGVSDFINITPEVVTFSDISDDAQVVYSDTYGEFAISVLLGAHLSDREKGIQAAVGWGGDTVVVREHEGTRFIIWRTEWDSESDSQEFFDAIALMLARRFPELSKTESLFSWQRVTTTESKFVRLIKSKSAVVLGMKEAIK